MKIKNLGFCINFVVMVIVFSKCLVPKRFVGITIFPFVILRNKNLKNDNVLLYHERIHLKQQLEMLVVFFFVWYGIEFLIRFIRHKNRFIAYRNISFEREAYANERDFKYLENRAWLAFLKYLK